MKDKNYILVWIARGTSEATLIKNYINSFGIEIISYEESAGRLYGLISTPLGEVELYVKKEHAERTNQLIADLQNTSGT